jgi:hypothetical protein
MGVEPDQAVTYILMTCDSAKAPKRVGADGRLYYIGATTFGPFFSAEIDAAAQAIDSRYTEDNQKEFEALIRTEDYTREVVKAARAAGADIDMWARAKVIQALAGSVAEAKATRKPIEQVMELPGIEGDIADIKRAWIAAGWSEERAGNEADFALTLIEEKFAIPQVWNALLALANSLPHDGRVEGHECWAVFSAALGE